MIMFRSVFHFGGDGITPEGPNHDVVATFVVNYSTVYPRLVSTRVATQVVWHRRRQGPLSFPTSDYVARAVCVLPDLFGGQQRGRQDLRRRPDPVRASPSRCQHCFRQVP